MDGTGGGGVSAVGLSAAGGGDRGKGGGAWSFPSSDPRRGHVVPFWGVEKGWAGSSKVDDPRDTTTSLRATDFSSDSVVPCLSRGVVSAVSTGLTFLVSVLGTRARPSGVLRVWCVCSLMLSSK